VTTSTNRIKEMTVDVLAGTTVDAAIASAIDMAKGNGCVVKFEFNGRPIWVDANSEVAAVSKGWWEIGRLSMKLHGAYVQPTGEVKWGSDGR
jgi:hypothetical protein